MAIFHSPSVIQARRFEGKPLKQKIKYLYANHPAVAFSLLTIFVFAPSIIAFRVYYMDRNLFTYSDKYRFRYEVVRDDDPKVPKLMAQKEAGRHLFPEK